MLSSVPCIDMLLPDKVCLCNEWGSDDYSFVRRQEMVYSMRNVSRSTG